MLTDVGSGNLIDLTEILAVISGRERVIYFKNKKEVRIFSDEAFAILREKLKEANLII